ncbi:MAG TPA: acyl carrier protein [Actinoplanes sp.]|nr:acyl carrier protein [Actinoplanes sp.]
MEQRQDDQAHRVLRIVADVLGRAEVHIGDNFYDFGGTSLHAMRICARIERELEVRVSPAALFDDDTMSGLVVAARPRP